MKILYADAELSALRRQREQDCFSVVNRGKLWYNCLTDEQLAELNDWYFAWLNVTDTRCIPTRPTWLDKKLEREEQIW